VLHPGQLKQNTKQAVKTNLKNLDLEWVGQFFKKLVAVQHGEKSVLNAHKATFECDITMYQRKIDIYNTITIKTYG